MSKKLTKRLTIFVAILLIGYLGFAWSLTNLILFPKGANLETSKGRIQKGMETTFEEIMKKFPTPEAFSVITEDGLTLRGKYIKNSDSSNCAIIFVHGWTATWAGMLKYTPVFDSCGCDYVFYDHRMHGESDDKYATGGIMEKSDLIKITNWLQEKTGFKDEQIGWVGASWGAATALQAGALDDKQVGFILADAPFQDWYSAIFERAIRHNGAWINAFTGITLKIVNMRTGVNYKDADCVAMATYIKSPVLLIHSKSDEATLSFQSENIAKNLNPSNSVFHLLDWGNGHTQDVIKNTEEYRDLTMNFLKKYAPNFGGCL